MKLHLPLIILFIFVALTPLLPQTAVEVLNTKVLFSELQRDSSGKLMGGQLAESVTLTQKSVSYTLGAGTNVLFYPDGLIKKCVLGSAHNLATPQGTIPISPLATIRFLENGEPDLLKSRFSIREEFTFTVSSREMVLSPSSRIFFLDNERLDYERSLFIPARYLTLKSGSMTIPVTINTEVSFFPSGNFKSCVLAENFPLSTPYGTITLLKGCYLALNEDGNPDYERTEVKPVSSPELTIGSYKFTFVSSLYFYDSGALRQGTLAEPKTISLSLQTLTVAKGTVLSFDPEGKIDFTKSGISIPEDTSLLAGGISYPLSASHPLEFYSSGALLRGTVSEDVPVRVGSYSLDLKAGTEIYFLADGSVDPLKTSFVIGTPLKLVYNSSTLVLKEGTRVYFDENKEPDFGRIKAYLAEPSTLRFNNNVFPLKQDTLLSFHMDGSVKSCTLASEITYSTGNTSLTLGEGSLLMFNDKKRLVSVNLGVPTRVIAQGNTYVFQKKTNLTFQENGSILEGVTGEITSVRIGVNTVYLPEGERIRFYENNTPIVLKVRMAAPGTVTVGNYAVPVLEGSTLSFDSEENLLPADSTIYLGKNYPVTLKQNQITLMRESRIYFYKDGTISSCTTGGVNTITLFGYTFPLRHGTNLTFSEEGDLRYTNITWELGEDCIFTIAGIKMPLSYGLRLYFTNEGPLFSRSKFVLREGITLACNTVSIPVAAESVLMFHDDGSPHYENFILYLEKNMDISIGGQTVASEKGSRITLHANGMPSSIPVSKDPLLVYNDNEVPVEGGKTYYFYDDGTVNFDETNCKVKKTMQLRVGANTVTISENDPVFFHPNGILKKLYIRNPESLRVGSYVFPLVPERNLFFNPDGTLDVENTKCILSENITFKVGANTIPFLAFTRLFFFDDGNLEQGILAEEMALSFWNYTIDFKAGKRLFFHKNGVIDSDRTEIFGLKPLSFEVGENTVTFRPHTRIYFDDNGRVEAGTLNEASRLAVGGKEILFSPEDMVHFHANGILKQGVFAEQEPVRIGTQYISFLPGSLLTFALDGSLLQGELASNQELVLNNQSILFKQYSLLTFGKNDVIVRGMPAKDVKVQVGLGAYTFDMRAPLFFHENGMVKSGLLAHNVEVTRGDLVFLAREDTLISFNDKGKIVTAFTVNPVDVMRNNVKMKASADTALAFYDDGSLASFFPAVSFEWKTAKGETLYCDPYGMVRFLPSGQIAEAVLMTDALLTVGNKKFIFAGKTDISFHEDGNVKSGYLKESGSFTINGLKLQAAILKEVRFFADGSPQLLNCAEKTGDFVSGEWAYRPDPQSAFYRITIDGVLTKAMPLSVGDVTLTIPALSLVGYKGGDTVFHYLVPSENIMREDKVLVAEGRGIFFDELVTLITQ